MGKGGNEMTDTQKTPGQIAYEARATFCEALPDFDWKGLPWDILSDESRSANEAAAEAVRAPLLERIAKLEARLEIDHVWRPAPNNEGDMMREEVPPEERDAQIDGIEARDCTIELLNSRIAELEAQRTRT